MEEVVHGTWQGAPQEVQRKASLWRGAGASQDDSSLHAGRLVLNPGGGIQVK